MVPEVEDHFAAGAFRFNRAKSATARTHAAVTFVVAAQSMLNVQSLRLMVVGTLRFSRTNLIVVDVTRRLNSQSPYWSLWPWLEFNECNGDVAPTIGTCRVDGASCTLFRVERLQMERPSELFAISALILVATGLPARFVFAPGLGVSVDWNRTGYVLPPSIVCYAMAAVLCFFAVIYSLWMVPFNRTATLVHFWTTTVGTAAFLVAFNRLGSNPSNIRPTIWLVFVVPVLVALAQVVFVWNLVQALAKSPRLPSS